MNFFRFDFYFSFFCSALAETFLAGATFLFTSEFLYFFLFLTINHIQTFKRKNTRLSNHKRTIISVFACNSVVHSQFFTNCRLFHLFSLYSFLFYSFPLNFSLPNFLWQFPTISAIFQFSFTFRHSQLIFVLSYFSWTRLVPFTNALYTEYCGKLAENEFCCC